MNEPKTKEYIRPMPATWWLRNRYLFLFMIREMTCLFVIGYAVFLLVLLFMANREKKDFRGFLKVILSPQAESDPQVAGMIRLVWIILHLIVLAFVVFHSVTSFNGVGKIMVIRRGEERVSPALVAGVHYAVWLMVSIVIVLVVLSA